MKIGVPKEIKAQEHRVSILPDGVRELTSQGNEVYVEHHAGIGIGVSNQDYEKVGAKVLGTAEEVFAQAEMVVKVKEPQPSECKLLKEDQLLFTYLHLAPDPEQAKLLLESKCTAIAYETVEDTSKKLPLLTPMSEVAGCMSIQIGARGLEKESKGRGILLGGVPGVSAGKVLVIGGGVSGYHAARTAAGMGAQVVILERSLERTRQLAEIFQGSLQIEYSTQGSLEEHLKDSDLVIGAVLIPGASAPKLISRSMLSLMQKGSVIVDIAIDQGGVCETSRASSHAEPFYEVDGVIHSCVPNIPGAVSRTSSKALSNATLPYINALAKKGWKKALTQDAGFAQGLTVWQGHIVHEAVAHDLGKEVCPLSQALKA